MGLPKNKKSKRKSKAKNASKRQRPRSDNKDNNDEEAPTCATGISSYSENTLTNVFRSDELQELKRIINLKDLSSMPLVLGAVILNKFDVVKKLVKQGYDVNEVGNENMTPLMWAVRTHNLDMIDMLVSRGARILQEDERARTVLCHAIAHIMQEKQPPPHHTVDLLIRCLVQQHESQQREQENSAKKSIDKNTEVSISSSSSPFECYLQRRLQLLLAPPAEQLHTYHTVIENITIAVICFVAEHFPSGYELLLRLHVFDFITEAVRRHATRVIYVQEVLAIAGAILCSSIGTDNEAIIGDAFITENAADVCLVVLDEFIGCAASTLPVAGGVALLALFVACTGPSKAAQCWLKENYKKLESFYSFLPDVFLDNFSLISDEVKRRICTFKRILDDLKRTPIVNNHSDIDGEEEFADDSIGDLPPTDVDISTSPATPAVRKSSKRARRKARALKARIDKIRSANVAERRHSSQPLSVVSTDSGISSSKEIIEIKLDHSTNTSSSDSIELVGDTTPIATTSTITVSEVETENVNYDSISVQNSTSSYQSAPSGLSVKCSETEELVCKHSEIIGNDNNSCNEEVLKSCGQDNKQEPERGFSPTTISHIIAQLRILLHRIVAQYESLWDKDARLGHPQFFGTCYILPHSYLSGSCERQYALLKAVLPHLEQLNINRLVSEFDALAERLENGTDDEETCRTIIQQWEYVLRNHEVRGEKPNIDAGILFDNGNNESVKSLYTDTKTIVVKVENDDKKIGQNAENPYGTIGDHRKCDEQYQLHCSSYSDLIENISPIPTTTPETFESNISSDELYLMEMASIFSYGYRSRLSTEDAAKIKQKTEDHAYHLIQSIYQIFDSDEPSFDVSTGSQISQQPATLMIHVPRIPIPTVSRWQSTVLSLRNVLKHHKTVCNGESNKSTTTYNEHIIFTCSTEMRVRYTIATGGNFGPVEVALDNRRRGAFAVKCLQDGATARLLIDCVIPLLKIRHDHLLHYVACERGPDGCVRLATPLCEYNLGEYLLFLKQQQRYDKNETSIIISGRVVHNLIRDLLTGLWYLHSNNKPIVHGNLKPSNILLDMQGKLRLAEFGIEKALYQDGRAPKSLIWFARETYQKYEQSGVIRCSPAADVQVAGMLAHFIATKGLHPFGLVTNDIVDNLIKGTPVRLHSCGNGNSCELDDLVSWMLVHEASNRPTVTQVKSHVYFWNDGKKWRFLLACSGLSLKGVPLIGLSLGAMHAALGALAQQHRITGDWLTVVKRRFPDVSIDAIDDDVHNNTPVGLLRFIRTTLMSNNISANDLQTFILKVFPSFPLSLFRLLENSDWLKHPIFTFTQSVLV